MPVTPGSRIHREQRGGYKWTCASCGTEQTTPFEQGCPACGTGTPEQAASVAREGKIPGTKVSLERVIEAVMKAGEEGVFAHDTVALESLSPAARLSVAQGLAMFGEHGTPSTEDLPRVVILAWAKHIIAVLEAAEGEQS